LGIHLFCCSCESERTAIHDTFQDIVVAIALENGTHVQREVSHLFLCLTRRQMDIVITKDSFRILVDVVIDDSTCTDLV
jgi:hypothetical protein